MNYVEALYQYIIGELAECKNSLFICYASRCRAGAVRVANRLRHDGYKVSVIKHSHYYSIEITKPGHSTGLVDASSK